MAVITRYIIIRDGEELDKVFTDRKEAEAYDKMLDAADGLTDLMNAQAGDLEIPPETLRRIAVFLAQNGPEVTRILKGIKPAAPPAKKGAGKRAARAAAGTEKPAPPAEAKPGGKQT